MEQKVIIIKLKSQVCDSISRFEESYEFFLKHKTTKRYYNFPRNTETSYLNEFIDRENYYFLAFVFNNDGENSKYEKYFLGVGTYNNEYKSLEISTRYSSAENNMTKSLRKLSDIDINKDFVSGEYISIENSKLLFDQLDRILSEIPVFPRIEREYGPIETEGHLHKLAQKNEYCRRQYNLRDAQEGRGEFQRDYERIVHSKAFRRMVDKAQVFSASKGDCYRTRMTHSQAVAQIARGIATELELNLNLTEAIALGHDLGHTPFGHQGERTLNDILHNKIPIIKNSEIFEDNFGGFKHNYQSVRVASMLEEEYFEIGGMDLSYQTLEGMLKHTSLSKKGQTFELKEFITADDAEEELRFDTGVCSTLEGQIVAIADEIAQRGHDLDDALSSGMISVDEFEKHLELKKMHELKEMVSEISCAEGNAKKKHYFFSDEKELKHNRVVSTVISYFINDVIKTSKNGMENYSEEEFKNNGYAVKESIIKFSDSANAINKYLETMIANRVINSSEVTLFDNNGATIVAGLFKAYYNNPRLIHKGTQRRIYAEILRHTKNVVDFELGNHGVINDEIQKITKADLSDENNEMESELKEEYKLKRRILVRNICDYISGMTDTYAINEFRRIEKQI